MWALELDGIRWFWAGVLALGSTGWVTSGKMLGCPPESQFAVGKVEKINEPRNHTGLLEGLSD